MKDKVFVDTNVFVYAYSDDDIQKHNTAKKLLQNDLSENTIVVSVQILNEFYSVMSKSKLSHKEITNYVREIASLCSLCSGRRARRERRRAWMKISSSLSARKVRPKAEPFNLFRKKNMRAANRDRQAAFEDYENQCAAVDYFTASTKVPFAN
jgi:predicted nucleic acid-binding protein